MKLKIISKSGILPKYETAGSAGFDIRAYIEEAMTLAPGERKLVPTGLYFQLEPGYEAQVRARSGLAIKKGIGLVNGIGTIHIHHIVRIHSRDVSNRRISLNR